MAKQPKSAAMGPPAFSKRGLSEPGFSDESTPFQVAPADPASRPSTPKQLGKFKVGPGGRVLVPADVREELGVKEGDYLLASICDGELRLMSIQTAVRRAQNSLRQYIPDGGPSAVDGLIDERRRENEQDSAE
jgi:AbrB family looped-hinge helix DNA binding protein